MATPFRKVFFYAIEAEDETRPLLFSAHAVAKKIASLNRESGEAYIKTGLFDELLTLVHDDSAEAHQMLSLWSIDRVNPPHFEHKGAVKPYEFMEGEGVCYPSYAMFFEDRFLAYLRPEARSPGVTALARYINQFCGANCTFVSLVNPDIMKMLQRPAEDIVKATVRVKTSNLARIGQERPDVEAMLRGVAGPTGSTEVQVSWKAALRKEKAPWWAWMKPMLRTLVDTGAIGSFEDASVTMTGGHPVDLLNHQLTENVALDMLKGEKQVKAEVAAVALVEAYQRRQDDLHLAYGAGV